MNLPELATTAEVSKAFHIPAGTLRYWRQAGIGPDWFKLEGTIRYNPADVIAYLEKSRRVSSVRASSEASHVGL